MGLKFRRGTTAQKSGSLAFGEPYVNTDLGTLQIGGATGDITLGASGTGSAGQFSSISGSSIEVSGNATIGGNLTVAGQLQVGDNTSDTLNVVASLSSSLIPSVTNAFDLGSASKIWRDIYVSTGSIKIINPGTGTVVGTITSNANGDVNTGTQNVSGSLNVTGSITPGATNTYDLGSPTKQWRHVYISTGSLYMNGTAILSSTATDLTLTTDAGQSLKLLETAADTITLQTAEGNLTLTSTGAGDVILDPNTGVVSVKGTLQIQDGNKITSSGGNTIQFGNNVAVTGSVITTGALTVGGNFVVNGTTTTIDSTIVNIGDNIIVLNGTNTTNGGIYVKDGAGASTLTGSMLWDTTNDKWIAGTLGNEIAILRTGGDSVVSGSSQITYASISSIPSGIVSGSSQITYASISSIPSGIVSGSSQVTGIGNAQLTNSSTTIGTTAIALGASSTTLAGLTSVTSTGFTGALTGNASTATTLQTARTINGTSFNGSADITIANLVSGSSQITYASISSIPSGIVSGSAQVTYASISSIPSGIVSGSAQTIANLPTGTVSGSSQITYASISSIPSGIVSGSSQITYASISSIPAGIVSGSAQVTPLLPTGVVSGSSQVTLSSTTGYGTVINQNLLTTSDVRHNSLGVGMAASATAGRIDASGDVVAYSTSDKNFKENITPIENPIEKIRMISGNTYDWKADMKEFHGFEGNDVGVIAQEIEAVLPQLVTTRETGYKAVKYDKLVALLIEGIKAQQNQIDNLTIEIEKLKESKGL